MAGIALGPGKKRILILCGDDAAAATAANVYAGLLRDHDLRFLEERIISGRRVLAFSRRRLRTRGVFSLLGSLAYYGLRLARPPRMPEKLYTPDRTVNNFTADPLVRESIRAIRPAAALVCVCSVLGPELLEILPAATYNIHPGITPRYRGFGNIWAAYENNFGCLGYTIHKIDAGTDTGERVAVAEISPRDLAGFPFADIDIPVAARAARRLASLLQGTEEALVPERYRDLPSRLYGVPTLGVFREARRNFAAGLRDSPRHICITGASSGLGKALAEAYASPGVRLTLWARDEVRLADIAARCREKGAETAIISQDIRDFEQSRAALAALCAASPVDLAILGAGVSSGTLPDGTPEPAADACRTMTVNATAAINMAGTLFELMRQRGSGQVACISSIAALYPLPDSPAYSAAKVALAYYAKAMRPLVRPLRVSVVYPGYVDTPMSRRLSGPQPMRWSADKAAAHIRDRLERGAESVVFPLPLAIGMAFLHVLPSRPANFFAERFGFSVKPDNETGETGETGKTRELTHD